MDDTVRFLTISEEAALSLSERLSVIRGELPRIDGIHQYKTYDEKIEWLRNRGILNRFINNLHKRLNQQSIKQFIVYSGIDTISSGFTWACSNEGINFWHRIDKAYRKWYIGNN